MSVAAVLVVAGCGSDEPDESEPSDNGSNENEPDENDNGD
jgi:hypothetical protein